MYPFNSLGDYKYADVAAVYKGKWIFCKHRDRDTWEHPAGHIEPGETPLEAAKRELYEETGAINSDIEPLFDYWVYGELDGTKIVGNGQVYFATIHALGELPCDSEMEKIEFFDDLPDDLTYPIICDFFAIALARKQKILIYSETT